jgi:hypothetical protein
VAICQRAALAGKDLASVLGNISWPQKTVSFDNPSTRRVWWTKHQHPNAQCRLDTYFHGAVCNKSFTIDFDLDDPRIGSCSREEGDEWGTRPRCWFKP